MFIQTTTTPNATIFSSETAAVSGLFGSSVLTLQSLGKTGEGGNEVSLKRAEQDEGLCVYSGSG